MKRRMFLQSSAAMALAAGCSSPATSRPAGSLQRMMVLGVDGMDHSLVQQFIAEGRLPNCKRLVDMGSFSPLATSNPPQSPVAWSNFISGTNPGGHGIFDFIARDTETMLPYQSISRVVRGSKPISIPGTACCGASLRRWATTWPRAARSR
jgi:hypothetical protein